MFLAVFPFGFITTHRLTQNPALIHFTPGVKLKKGKDSLGQQYLTPQIVLEERECDVIIVGRGICQAVDPQKEAESYRLQAWNSYKQRVK